MVAYLSDYQKSESDEKIEELATLNAGERGGGCFTANTLGWHRRYGRYRDGGFLRSSWW